LEREGLVERELELLGLGEEGEGHVGRGAAVPAIRNTTALIKMHSRLVSIGRETRSRIRSRRRAKGPGERKWVGRFGVCIEAN